ncbi:hypothetical protein LDENG_00061140 [Lucifuga dentata]|nr:hypothetical protein LDENG_00061140 [Lucifuga dentata]
MYFGNECNAVHNKLQICLPNDNFRRIGTFLDHKAGTLSWYGVTNDDKVKHIHTFNAAFNEPVYPGYWFGGQEYIYLL